MNGTNKEIYCGTVYQPNLKPHIEKQAIVFSLVNTTVCEQRTILMRRLSLFTRRDWPAEPPGRYHYIRPLSLTQPYLKRKN